MYVRRMRHGPGAVKQGSRSLGRCFEVVGLATALENQAIGAYTAAPQAATEGKLGGAGSVPGAGRFPGHDMAADPSQLTV